MLSYSSSTSGSVRGHEGCSEFSSEFLQDFVSELLNSKTNEFILTWPYPPPHPPTPHLQSNDSASHFENVAVPQPVPCIRMDRVLSRSRGDKHRVLDRRSHLCHGWSEEAERVHHEMRLHTHTHTHTDTADPRKQKGYTAACLFTDPEF